MGGLIGWESVNVPEVKNGLTVLNKDDDHFFTELDVSYYPKDDLRLSAGYHYESETSLAVAELEYLPRWFGVPASLFATGYFGEEEHTRITGGIRFYIGADRDKSLIRRHREDDPTSYTPVFPELRLQTVQSVPTTAQPMCGNGVVDPPAEQCDDGNLVNGDGCDSMCRFEVE